MAGDNYLHVQKWRHIADKAEVSSLPVWIRFPVLPVEYYIKPWQRRAWNNIGRTIKVDVATLLASRGKFTRVCVEVDLHRPFMSGYHLHGDFWRLQYEGLEHYGHRSLTCPIKALMEKE